MELVAFLFFGISIGSILLIKILQYWGRETNPVPVLYHDGGRQGAGYRGTSGDCVTRSLAIATGYPYAAVYSLVDNVLKHYKVPRGNPDRGVIGWVAEGLMEHFGGVYHGVPDGTFFRPDTIPSGIVIVWLKKHTVAVIDKVAYDTFDDPFRREMYGYWTFPDRRKR